MKTAEFVISNFSHIYMKRNSNLQNRLMLDKKLLATTHTVVPLEAVTEHSMLTQHINIP